MFVLVTVTTAGFEDWWQSRDLKRLPKRMRFFSDWLCWFLVTLPHVRSSLWHGRCVGVITASWPWTSQAQGIYKAYEGDGNGCSRLSISRFSRNQVHVDPEELTSWKGDVTWRLLFEIPLFWSSIPNPMGWFNTTLSTALPQRFQQVAFQKAKASKVSWNVLISMSSLNLQSRLSIPARSNGRWDQNSLKDSTPSSAAWNHVHDSWDIPFPI